MGNINNEHDVGYKYLLSAKQVFVQLLRSFVDTKWVEKIDAPNTKLLNHSFTSADFQEKEADLVYRMKVNDQEIIFYLLLELQSTVDYQMPYRLLLYMVEIWRKLHKSSENNERKSKNFRLPVIIPIVLYNGIKPWTVPLEFKNYQNQPALFKENVLNFKFNFFRFLS